MAIKESDIEVVLGGVNISHYEDLGYEIPRYKYRNKMSIKQGTTIKVKINDLHKNSRTKVTKICDECGIEIPNTLYIDIISSRKNGDGKDRCKKCANKKQGETKRNNVKYENSAEYFAINNNKEYLLNEFSSKNEKKLSEISYANNNKFLWNCTKCKSEYDMVMSQKTTRDNGCPYCSGSRINNTNCLWTTHPHIAKLLTNAEKGYKVNAGSGKKESFTCPDCGNIEDKRIQDIIKRGFSCSKCSDGISFSEKITINILKQLKIKFNTQKRFSWSKIKNNDVESLNGIKIYDFHIPSLNCIIETHGMQHYEGGFESYGGRSIKEEQENDKLKEQLAKENGIENYIVIDCRYSEMEFIKNNIINSELNNLFDLSQIDWSICYQFACKSLINTVCNHFNDGLSCTIIAEIMNLSKGTITKYLKHGTNIGLCNYDPKKIQSITGRNSGIKNKKKIVQLSNNHTFIKEWNSARDASRELGVNYKSISAVCNGKRNFTGGYRWMFKEDYDEICS